MIPLHKLVPLFGVSFSNGIDPTRKNKSALDELFMLVDQLENQEKLRGMRLWQKIVETGYPLLLGLAEGVIFEKKRLCAAALVSEIVEALTKRFAKKADVQPNCPFGNYKNKDGPLARYLAGTILRELRSAAKRLGKTEMLTLSDQIEQIAATTAAEPDKWLRWKIADVLEAVNALESTLREPLVLFYLEKKKIREIARDLKMRRSTVHDRIKKGLKRLKETLHCPEE
jgi:RNA polymerase sigma factor (sigma-70 family)